MIDHTTPLDDTQIALCAKLGVGLYRCQKTGQTFVSKAYLNGITEHHRAALRKALS